MKINFKASVFLIAVFVAGSNLLVEYPINRWITWGSFLYPFTYLITEVTNYYHGPKAARKVVLSGFFVAILFSLGISNYRIALGSTSAFLMSQLLDIIVFSKLRNYTWWLAPLCASVSATLLDSVIFFGVAFIGVNDAWLTLAVGTALTKATIDLLLLLPFRLVMTFKRSDALSNPSRRVPV